MDRYLLRSTQWQIPTIVIFNKCDLLYSEKRSLNQEEIKFEFNRIKSLLSGFYMLSAKNPLSTYDSDKQSLDDLVQFVNGKTVIFMGQSGVGKSKLIQSIGKGQLQTLSQDLGVVGKGVHTTTWTELHILPSLILIDSPGIRSLSINDLKEEELFPLMPDLYTHSSQCKFHNCTHEEKSKGCFFWSKEFKENSILASRFQSYLRFLLEIRSGKSWDLNKD